MTVSDPLVIVHVVRQFHPAIGGMEEFVEQLAVRQVAAGHTVRVITLNRIFDDPDGAVLAQCSTYRGIQITRVAYAGSKRYPLAPAIMRHLNGCDIVHVHGVDFFCDFLALASFLMRNPLILSTHGGFFHTRFASKSKRIYFDLITRASLKRYGSVIACSEQDYERFSRIAGDRTTLIRNPVDVEKFPRQDRSAQSTAIYFGRFDENKRLDLLLEWFAALQRAQGSWQLILAGRPGSLNKRTLLKHVNALGLDDRVEIYETPGREELVALVARASVYCCASDYEGFGLAAVEAAGGGLYPVLSNIPPFRKLVEALGYGQLIDFDRPEGWSAAFDELAERRNRFHEDYDEEAIAKALSPYSWERSAERFEEVYRGVLGRHRRLIGAVKLNVFERESAVENIKGAIDQKTPMAVHFCNAHTVNLAARNPSLQKALSAGIVLNDGVGVDMASRLLFGETFPSNLNGTDFVPEFIERHARDLRIFLVGGEPGVAEAAAAAWQRRHPELTIVGAEHGYFEDMECEGLVRRASEAGANMLLVGMGQPRQELWVARHWKSFPGPTLCVGALFDFVSHRVPRAPDVLRRLRLEWLYRLWVEPRRLARRYVVGNFAFIARVVHQKLSGVRL